MMKAREPGDIAGRLRIALYHSTLPEPRRKPGGVEAFVDRLANRLATRGHDVSVVSFVRPPTNAKYEWTPLRPSGVGRSSLGRILVAPAMLNASPALRLCDVLHLHGDDWFFVRRDVPTVRTFHGSAYWEARTATSFPRKFSQSVLAPLERWSSRLATHSYSLGPGHPGLHRLDGHLDPGIDLDPPSTESRSQVPSVLFVGTWKGRKRGAFLHHVFQNIVRRALPSAELWMVSDGCEPGPGVRHFYGVDDDELLALYRQAWVFCLPSTYEGFGFPYLEAMAHGTPVVATANLGARYVTQDGHAGLLVSDEEVGEALVRLLSNDRMRTEFVERGRSVAMRFSWEASVEAHERAYRAAIAAFAR